MSESPIRVFSIKYRTTDMEWDANILAYSKDEAIETLKRKVPTLRTIYSVGSGTRVDALSNRVLEKISDFFNLVQKPTNIEKTEEPKKFYCSECDKEFKTGPALKAHNTRIHKGK